MSHVAHLSEDRLANACLEGDATPAELRHLETCPACDARRAALTALIGEVVDTANREADAIFTPERLAVQQSRILQRIAHVGRPARVIAFPAGSSGTETRRLFRARPAVRWIAVAAVAGLVVGLVVGRWTNGFSSARGLGVPARAVSARLEPVSPFTPASVTLSDDELLGQIELAAAGPVGVLQPLHELTPLVGR